MMQLSSRRQRQFSRAVMFVVIAWPFLMPRTSEAQRRGGGGAGGGGGRHVGGGAGSIGANTGSARTSSGGGNRLSGGYGGAARTSVNRDFSNTSVNRNVDNANINRTVNNTNINRNINNVNVNRNYDVDVDVDNNWHPAARAAAWTAGAAVTAAAIGSIAYALPPSCTTVVVGGMSYQQCGSTWYEPRFSGTSVSYVVVSPPR
jgi:hypothetical protein